MRLTKLIDNQYIWIKDSDYAHISGDAIDKLAKLENMIDELNKKNKILSSELEQLRLDGMTKTYNFREKMGMKLTNSKILMVLEEYKII